MDIDPLSPYEKIDIFSSEFRDRFYGKYDISMCLEVAEHMAEAKASELIKVLTMLAPTVLFSAAVPGQGGHGHINCQPKQYWIDRFAELNYVVDQDSTQKLLNFICAGPHMGWFRNNAVVFKNYGAACYERITREETPQAKRLAEYISSYGL